MTKDKTIPVQLELPFTIDEYLRNIDFMELEQRVAAHMQIDEFCVPNNDSWLRKAENLPPKCHFTFMELQWADDGAQTVEWWECKHCGHTIEADRYLSS